jgi:hypothetical protein
MLRVRHENSLGFVSLDLPYGPTASIECFYSRDRSFVLRSLGSHACRTLFRPSLAPKGLDISN